MSGRITRWLLRGMERLGPQPPPAAAEHLATGRRGEQEAYFYLRRCGYVVVARNWRSRLRRGEIDLIAWQGGVLCFVEVKTRTTRAVKPAETAVDRPKQLELSAMARQYLRNLRELPPCRFDIVSVYYEGAREMADIALFQNAFSMD